LAHEYIQKAMTPQIVVVFGLMGTGKTSLAKALAGQTGWPVISSDETRKNLKGISPTMRKWEPFGKGIYSEVMSRKTYLKIRLEAKRLLEQGHSVILDGSYKRQSERLALMDLAKKTGARIQFLECRAPLIIIRRRLAQRKQDTKAISDGRWEIFKYQRQDFDPVIDPVKSKWVGVKTTKPAEQITQNIIRDIQTDA
jgi:predicted kinase